MTDSLRSEELQYGLFQPRAKPQTKSGTTLEEVEQALPLIGRRLRLRGLGLILRLLDRLRHPGQPEARLRERPGHGNGNAHAADRLPHYLTERPPKSSQRVAAARLFIRRLLLLRAAPAAQAQALYEKFLHVLRHRGLQVETGVFQAMMEVELVNAGPVTLLVDTDRSFY